MSLSFEVMGSQAKENWKLPETKKTKEQNPPLYPLERWDPTKALIWI